MENGPKCTGVMEEEKSLGHHKGEAEEAGHGENEERKGERQKHILKVS